MKTILITFFILFISLNCYADKYKRIESLVIRYELVAEELDKCSKIISKYSTGSQLFYTKLKTEYNDKYDTFIETAYMLEEIIIIEGGLTFDDLIVPMNARKGNIDDIGKRRYTKSVDELIKDISVNLKQLSQYTMRVFTNAKKRKTY